MKESKDGSKINTRIDKKKKQIGQSASVTQSVKRKQKKGGQKDAVFEFTNEKLYKQVVERKNTSSYID